MRKIFFTAFIAASLFLTNGCGRGSSSTGDPKVALITFFETLGKKDIEGARKLATADSKTMLDLLDMGLKMDKGTDAMNKFDKEKMEFGEPKIEGDKATVAVKEKNSGEMLSFTLKKESGAWKVAFDMASLMEMGIDKAKEKGEVSVDSLNKGLDELKKINIDSVKDALKKGMQAFDSIDKELDKLKQ
jgi:hypothetical protein